MKINLLSAVALAAVMMVSCSQKGDDQAEKIKALEDKIAALEGANTAVNPVNAQTTTEASER